MSLLYLINANWTYNSLRWILILFFRSFPNYFVRIIKSERNVIFVLDFKAFTNKFFDIFLQHFFFIYVFLRVFDIHSYFLRKRWHTLQAQLILIVVYKPFIFQFELQ